MKKESGFTKWVNDFHAIVALTEYVETVTDEKFCDDTQREHGNESKAQKIADICAEKDWVTISMANDWTTIYGEHVTINPQ